MNSPVGGASQDGGGGGAATTSSSSVTVGAHTLSSADTTLNFDATHSTSNSGTTLDLEIPSSSSSSSPTSSGSDEVRGNPYTSGQGVRNEPDEKMTDSDLQSGSEYEIPVPDYDSEDDIEVGPLEPVDRDRQFSRDNSMDNVHRDPDGEKAGSRSSLHAESINPTDGPNTAPRVPSRTSSQQTTSDPSFASQSIPSLYTYASGSVTHDSVANAPPSGGGGGDTGRDVVVATGAGGSEQPKIQKATFPSSGLLFGLGITIVLVVGGIVTGVTVYGRTPNVTDPLPVPTVSPSPTVIGQTLSPTILEPTPSPSIQPTVTPQVFFNLFETVVGPSVNEEGTSANLAANWMVNDDPAGYPLNFNTLSEAAWIQRYLLVYLYYATTNNRESEWLSCNPPPDDAPLETACTFANPTEVPGGRVIYDFIPSNRWLSAAQECNWAGITCQTVSDDVSGGRLAVTSINLAGQDLIGSVVTELVELPSLVTLDLSHNTLNGTLFDGFRGLQTLRLQNNELTGTIPSNFFDNESVMQLLNIGSNSMIGTIPGEVGLASKLTGLYLFDNDFTGVIPVLGNMPLQFFQGYSNNFTGMLPFDLFFGVWADTISEWWVYDNQLTGELPGNLGLFPNLRDFRVGQNQLQGSIPISTYTLGSLFRLELNDNLLTGTVDPSIRGLTSLETFDVSGNSLNGTVPEEIAEIQVLQNVQVQENFFGGTIPSDLCFLDSMVVLIADCLPESSPPTQCYCCTTCCDRDTKACVTYSQ